MVQPSRELIYQTLEKLIKERKVYQTSHGYFVVTPDTFRYMSSSNNIPVVPTLSHANYQQLQPFHTTAAAFSTNTLTLDALIPSPPALPPANSNLDSGILFYAHVKII